MSIRAVHSLGTFCRLSLLLVLGPLASAAGQDARPRVVADRDSPWPPPGARGAPTSTIVLAAFDLPIDPKTLSSDHFRLLEPGNKAVSARVEWDAVENAAILTPVEPLKPRTSYTIDSRFGVRGRDGRPSRPFSSIFTTGDALSRKPEFAFRATKIEERDALVAVKVGPDGHLYVADAVGFVVRLRLDPETGLAVGSEIAARLESRRIAAMAFDPDSDSDADRLTLWVSHSPSRSDAVGGGAVSRLTLGAFGSGTSAKVEDVLIGLPHGRDPNRRPLAIAFGPDGKLYFTMGALTPLGGAYDQAEETLFSSTVAVADARSSAFNGGKRPCDVSAIAAESPTSPVKVFATGLAQAYGLCWRSNGQLYAASDQNFLRGEPKTPGRPGAPAVNSLPRERLALIRQGKHYGHPNPKRGGHALDGGNPTSGVDPFEVPEYPVGVQPHRDFDPSLIRDLRPSGVLRPGGLAEWTADGPLKGRLLVASTSGGKSVQTFACDEQGLPLSADERPLADARHRPLRFLAPADIAVHPRLGAAYVADFGMPDTGDQGAVWLLSPIQR